MVQSSTVSMGAVPAALRVTTTVPGLKNAGIVWGEATFKEFIVNPGAKVPGTKMILAFNRGDKDIADLWAYIKQFGPDGKIK